MTITETKTPRSEAEKSVAHGILGVVCASWGLFVIAVGDELINGTPTGLFPCILAAVTAIALALLWVLRVDAEPETSE